MSAYEGLGEAIRESGLPLKSRVALVEADRDAEIGRWTHGETHREAERFGALLQSHGIRPGDRVAILMSNQSKWIFSGLGILWAGGILVPLDYKLTAPEQAALLAHCRPAALVVERALWEKLSEALPRPSGKEMKVFVTEASEDGVLKGAHRWEEAPARGLRPAPRRREDVAAIVYSSGTGGRAKGCLLTHENYLSQIEQLGNLVEPTEEDRYLSIIPTNHAIDFMCGFLIPLLCGSWVVHQRTLRSQFLLSTMRRYGVTLTALVPLLLKAFKQGIEEELERQPEMKRSLFEFSRRLYETVPSAIVLQVLKRTVFKPVHDRFGGRLRRILAGGAFVEKSLCDFFYRLGIPVSIGYGMTEAGTAITLNDLKPYRGDTVGRPVPGTQVEIRSADELGVGEVWVRGPSVMRGYLDDPELTEETLVEGWLRTGDLGFFDVSGHLRLSGRAKNMIVTEGGKNIYPEDVEALLGDVLGCEEYCVFAGNYLWPKRRWTDENLAVLFRPRKGVEVSAVLEEFRAHNRRLADYKRLGCALSWAEEFPRTATMKVKRQLLAERVRERPENAERLQKL
ncbi:MAG: AMP-binding protein [Deltaproteobacteria bacterium]|nr:AMP-binding protein [Deltaproteobacteria bacterium]